MTELPTPATDAPDQPVNNRKGWYWPFLIAGFLLVSAAFDLIVMAIASNHPSIAIDEGYYKDGEGWLEARTNLEKSAEMGWTVRVESDKFRRSRSPLDIRFDIADRDGTPIDLGHATVSVFHVARPRDVVRTEISAEGEGRHRVTVPVVRPGGHEVRLEGSRGADRFVWSTRVWITVAP